MIKNNYPKERYPRTAPHPWTNRDWLYNEYIVKDRSAQSIAVEYGCKKDTIYSWVSDFSISKPRISSSRKRTKRYQQYDYLYKNHILDGKSMAEIAKENNISGDTVRENLLACGITPRRSHQPLKLENRRNEIIDLYVNKKMSANQISILLTGSGSAHHSVSKVLQTSGIQTRTIQDAQFNLYSKETPQQLLDKDYLTHLYWNEGKNSVQIGKDIEVDPATVARAMKRLGIPRRTSSEAHKGVMVGKEHPNWQGGVTELKALLREYFYINLSKPAAKRANYTCQICGKTHCVLHCHHKRHFAEIVNEIIQENLQYDPDTVDGRLELYKIIVSDKRFLDTNNLIILCVGCHRKQHTKTTHKDN